ncbi:MAG: hypothetical protein REI12_09635 [Pedobacter sp.]|nr:hypothetical protein [Pedobacter sp.]
MKTNLLNALLLATALTAPAALLAAEPDAGSRGAAPHQPPGPPPEALAACKGKAVGAAATLTTPDGQTIKGKCELVFHPERPPQDGRPPKS